MCIFTGICNVHHGSFLDFGWFDMEWPKEVYSYDSMDNFQKFNDTQLPSKDDFYNLTNDEHITDEDFKHAVTNV